MRKSRDVFKHNGKSEGVTDGKSIQSIEQIRDGGVTHGKTPRPTERIEEQKEKDQKCG